MFIFQFLHGTIKSQYIQTAEEGDSRFQFLHGTIKRVLQPHVFYQYIPFQFLHGTIKRYELQYYLTAL